MSKFDLLPLQMECTLFFQQNSYTFETIDGLALRLGRKPEHIGLVLDHLVCLSILEKIGEGNGCIYRYIIPDQLSELELTWEQNE
jgi:hypothetical protein